MSCCGQKRAATRRAAGPAAHARPFTPSLPAGPGAARVVYSGVATVRVYGERTGRSYVFSAAHRSQVLERGDIASVLRSSPLFALAS